MDEIINRIEKSGLITIDLEEYFPKEKLLLFDLKDFLYEGLILREKEFRQNLSELDWSQYKEALVAVECISDAIIPSWAYLLVANYLTNVASFFSFGSEEDLLRDYYSKIIAEIDTKEYTDKKIIVKGCSRKAVPQNAYLQLISKLKPWVSSLMFGEACSTVPIYKKGKK